jgi:hypothetical protein
MGFRFRKSFKLAPGVRLNLGAKSGSISLGRPGATVNLSRRGVRSTFGIPGTGLSWSSTMSAHQLAGGRGANVRQLVAAQRAAERAQRVAHASSEVEALERAERDVLDSWRDMPVVPSPDFYRQGLQVRPLEKPGDAPQRPSPQEARIALMRDALRSALEDPPYWRMSAALLAALVVSNLIFFHVSGAVGLWSMIVLGLLAVAGPVLPGPLRQFRQIQTCWPEVWAEIQQQHAVAHAEWEQARATTEAGWQEREAERIAWVERLLAGDVEALGETLADTLADLDFPFETSCRVGVLDGMRAAVLIDLPEIEDVVSETKRRVLRDGRVKETKRTKTERATDYATLASGLGLWVARACFAAAPTLATVTVAAYTQRRQSGSGERRDEFVYEFGIERAAATAIDGSNVEPTKFLTRLGGRIDLRASGELERIEPPVWQQELA